jgi:hypothetical protein
MVKNLDTARVQLPSAIVPTTAEEESYGKLTIGRRYLQTGNVSNNSTASMGGLLTEIPRLELFGERHGCDMKLGVRSISCCAYGELVECGMK